MILLSNTFVASLRSFGIFTDDDIIAWWSRFPGTQLRQLAYDLLSIPATSTDAERAFSSAKRLVTNLRQRLIDEYIESYELLRYWWRHGISEPRGVFE